MASKLFLTFDLGTTLYKLALFDEAGQLIALERVVPPIERPQPGWAILRSPEPSRAIFQGLQKLKERVGGEWNHIAAISYATQANTFSFTYDNDESGMYILWSDQRAVEMAAELAGIAELPDFRRSTGLPRFGLLSALAKVYWLRKHDRKMLAGAEEVCFLNHEAFGYFAQANVCEAGEAALTGALDIRTLQWRNDILKRLQVTPLKMPAVHRAGTVIRTTTRDEVGIPRGCRIVVGCLDQYAGAIGTGTVVPGLICETTGTVLAAVRCSDQFRDDLSAEVYEGPGFDDQHFWQMSFSSTSANLLEWYRNRLPDRPTFEELTRLAESAAPSDLIIEPYDDRGGIEQAFRHVRPEHTIGQIVRAIMQRVAQSLKQQVENLCQGNLPASIRSAGGASKNDYWLQMKADALGVPFEAMECEEPTSLGAAMLAARALGYGELAEIAQRWVRVRKRFAPRGA
jgi:sugar (pentulose or hexulose) kinase